MIERLNPTRWMVPAVASLLLVAMLSACFGGGRSGSDTKGSVSARLVWPQESQMASQDRFMPFDTPTGVVGVRVTLSGADFATIQQIFSATAGTPGTGVIANIPAGTDRVLLVEGLNASDGTLYQGQLIGITILPGQRADLVVPMSLVTSIPPAPPTIISPSASPYYSNTTSLDLTGACTSTDPHTVLLSGPQSGSQACAASRYTFPLVAPGPGTYLFNVAQSSNTTLLTSPSATQIWVVDNAPPPVVGFISPSSNPVETSGNTLLITGSCETGSTVSITGASTGTVTCVAGTFSVIVAASVDGTYDYTLVQTDLAGNVSSSTSLTWIRNAAVPPPPTLTSPAVNPYYASTDLTTIRGGCITGLTVSMSGAATGSTPCVGGAYAFTLGGPYTDGTRSFVIRQQGSGSPSGDLTLTWVRDSVAPPPVTITAPAVSPVASSGTSLLIAGTCAANATVNLTGADTLSILCIGGGFSFALTKSADGTYDYALTQTDIAGNTSAAVPQQWIRDNAPPVAPSIIAPAADPAYSNQAITVSGGCTSTGAHTVRLGGAATDQVPCTAGGYSFLVALPAGGDGSYALTVRQLRDATGALSPTASRTWTVDTVPPAAVSNVTPSALQTISSGDLLVVSGTCSAGETIRLGGDDTQTQLCSSGTFSFTVTKTVDGVYNLAVTQVDRAGNVSPATTRQWVRSAAPPATPTITVPSGSPYYSNTLLPTIQGSCTSTLPHTVYLTGQQTTSTPCSGGAFSFALADPGADGTFTYSITQSMDGTGTSSGAAALIWVLDRAAPPPVTVVNPSPASTVTSTSTFTLDGTCDSGATVNLGGAATQSAACSGGGFSFTVTKTVDATYTFSITQTDQAGNTSSAVTRQWIRSTAVPATPTLTTPAATPYYSSTLLGTIQGTCTSTSAHTVHLGGQQTASTPCSAGTFSFALADPGADGTYSYSVAQTRDGAGISSASVAVTWVLDRVAPAALGNISPSAAQTVSSGNTLSISATCETGATVGLSGSDTQSATCSAGSVTFTVTKTVDGTYDFSLAQTDRAGNVSTAVTRQWVRNSGVPATPVITTPAASPYLSNALLGTIQGTCTSALAHTVTLSGQQSGTTPCSSGTFSFTLDDPGADGTYTYNVTQTLIGAGTTSGADTQTWVLDRVAPATVTITSPAASPVTTTGNSVVISGGCESNATVNLTGSATQSATCSGSAYSFTVSQTVDGTYTYALRQTDGAGNPSAAAAGQVWVRDTQVPTAPVITSPGSPHASSAAFSLVGTCTSTTAHTVTLAGAGSQSVACAAGAFSFALTDPGTDGTYAYTVTQTRVANGQTSPTAGFTWIRDTLAPATVTITNPAASPVTTAGSALVIAGACESNATVNLTGSATQSTPCSSATYSFTVNQAVDGTYTYSLRQTDVAGNTSATAATQVWVRDSAVPATPTVTSHTSPHVGNTATLTISGTCTSAVPHTVHLGGQETQSVACGAGAFAFTLANPGSEGTFAYTVSQSRDATGVSSLSTGFSWIRDTTAPAAVTITTPATTPITTTGNSLTISGACETNATVNLTGSATQSTTCASSAYAFSITNTVDGTYTYALSQTDAAGNPSATAASQVWVRDTQVPTAPTITSPANPFTGSATTISISGTCTSATAHTVNLTGQQVLSVACAAGAFTFNLTDPAADGSYSYNLTQTRNANGLTSSATAFTWNRDTTPPGPVTITTPATSPVVNPGASITISGGCVSGLVVSLSGNDAQTTSCAASAYAFTVAKAADGLYTFSLVQTDAAGNVSTAVTQQWQRGTPMFTVSPTALSSTEGGTPQTFSVSINMPPNGNVRVDVVSSDTTEATVDKATLTFTTVNWATAQVVTVTPEADAVADGNQTATIILSVNGPATTDTIGYAALDPANVSMTVLDASAPGVTVTPTSGLTTTEAGATATFSVVLNKAPNGNVEVSVGSTDATEVSTNKTALVFTTANWSTPQVVTLTGLDDAIVDGNQTVTVSVTINAGNTADTTGYAALNPPDVTVVNNDNDAVAVTVTPSSGLAVGEGGSMATFSVVLNTVPNGTVTLDVTSLDASEVSVDKPSLVFTASDWFTPQVVTITGVDDAIADGNQTVTVSIATNGAGTADTTGYAALNPPDVQVTNSDNDAAGVSVLPAGTVTTEGGGTTTFSVWLNTQPAAGKVVLIDVASQDTTEATVSRNSLTFTELDWQTAQTVTVTGVDDLVVDGNQSVIIALTINTLGTTDTTGYATVNPPDVTILNTDNDVAGVTVTPTTLTTSENGASGTVSVRLNTQPAAASSVVILVQNGDATEISVDKSTLTFTVADWQTPQIITITGLADGLTDGNQAVNVALITDTLLTTDPVYDPIDPADVAVLNLDNTPAVTVTPTSGLTTTELGGTATFSVVLNAAPTAGTVVIVNVVSGDTTEVTVDKSVLNFDEDNWATPQVVTLTGVDDALPDGSQLVTIALTMNGGTTAPGYTALNPADVAVTNSDDELIEVVVNPTSGLVTTESGASATFTVTLSSLPTGNVLVDILSLDTSEATTDKAQLTFTTADWQTPQTVTVKGVNDTATDGNQPVTIQVTVNVATADPNYRALNPPDVSATNLDNEPPSQGTAGAPVDLTASLPAPGSTTTTGASYYYVSGLLANTQYFVTLSSLINPAIFNAYDNSAFTVTAGHCLGNQNSGDSRPKSCYATSNGSGELWIVVTTSIASGSTYKIDVQLPPVNEGSTTTPINLTGLLPYPDGQVGANNSYYMVTGLTPGAGKYVRLTNLTQNIDLFVYSDAAFTTQLCTSAASTIAEACVATVPGSGTLYIRARNVSGQPGATYTVGVVNPPATEGSVASPVDVTGLLPYGGTMVSPGSYYRITGLTPGTVYTVSMTEMTSGGSLRVYSDSGFTAQLCASNGAVNLPESCQAAANASGLLYINANPAGLTGAGATTFNIRLQ